MSSTDIVPPPASRILHELRSGPEYRLPHQTLYGGIVATSALALLFDLSGWIG